MTDAIRELPDAALLFGALVVAANLLMLALLVVAAIWAQVDDALRQRADEAAARRASARARHEDADRVRDHDWPYGEDF